MNVILRFFYISAVPMALSSCASFENLTDDRKRLEDDEMYWNRKELFYDNSVQGSSVGAGIEDDYYDPSYANRSNSINGATNPRASFNPISGWQLSYGFNTFSNYGLNSSIGNNSFYPYSGYSYNSFGYGTSAMIWGNGFGGYNNVVFQNVGGGASGYVETSNVTHFHRRPVIVNSGNSSSYSQGGLRKNLIQPISVSPKAPVPVKPSNCNISTQYSPPPHSMPSNSSFSSNPSHSGNSQGKTSHSGTDTARDTPIIKSPNQSLPPNNSPARSMSTPTNSMRTTPVPSSPSRPSSTSKRP